MKLDEREVPAPVLTHWKHAIDGAPSAALNALTSIYPSLKAGFRPGKVPPAQLRARVKAMLDSSTALPEVLRKLLVDQGLQRQLVCVLSEAAIDPQAASWADALGRAEFFSAMLLDDRATVRSAGFAQTAGWDGQDADSLAAARARQTLIDEFGPFLRCVAPLVHGLPGASTASSQGSGDGLESAVQHASSNSPASSEGADKERLCKTDALTLPARPPRPAQERALVLQLRAQRLEARRAQRACDEAQRDRDRLAARLETTDTHLTEARAELRRLSDELRNTQARIDELVRDGVQAQLDARLRPWLAPAEALERAVQDLGEDTLAAQAEALLRRQAEIDRREGLRSALVAELQRTQAALAEVQRAQVDALNPLPQLPEMARRLRVHAAALQSRLDAASASATSPAHPDAAVGETTTVTSHEPLARLHQVLAATHTLDSLAEVRRQLQAAEPLSLLTAGELARAYSLLHDAAGRLYDRSAVAAGVTHPPALDARAFPLQALQRTLASGRSGTLVVDGHNVLHLLPKIFRAYYDSRDQPTAEARRALADRLLDLAARYPSLHVELWFDGPVQDTRALSERVRLHFSGGSGSNRADRAIIAQVHHLANAGGNLIAVASADGEVRADAQSLNALLMYPVELGLWFGDLP